MRSGLVLMGLMCGLLSGCQTVEQARQADARRQVEQRYAEEQQVRMQGQLDALAAEQMVLREELAVLQAEVRGVTVVAQSAQEQARLAEAEQARVVNRVQDLLKRQLAERPADSNARGAGHEHVVESGHTLSAIAVAYGSTVKAIKAANNLSSDQIFVGQKLFIPQ